MTITAQTAKSGPYSGNGVTVVFDYTFKIVDDDDLVVTLQAADGTETVQTLTTDYTVAGGGDAAGGQITMVTAPATGEKLVITRAVDLTQEVNLENRGAFVPEVIEQSFDKLTQIAQDHQEQLDRSIKVDKFDDTDLDQLVSDITDLAAIDSDISTVAGISSDVTTVSGNSADVTTVAGISGNVTTVAGISADVTTVAADGADIGTVATNISNVNTVAGISANVTTVAGISADVTTVAADGADIGTVAGLSTEVAALGPIAADITTVSGISSDVTAVAADATDIGTVSTNIASVNTVAGISADVTTVAADGTDIGTVAGISGDVTTVAGVASDVTTVAGISADVTTVAADGTDIGTVAGISGNVTTVAGIAPNVTTVAGISANVTTVAGVSADVSTVAGISTDVSGAAAIASDITAVAADAVDIGTVAGISADVTTVAADGADIGTVAGISANVTTVAGVSADVTTVAGISADVTAVAADAADIGTVATNIASVNTVAGDTTAINTVSTNIADVTAVAADATDIGTVATNIANVNTVAGDTTAINTVVTNLAEITNFADVYIGAAASDPTTRSDGSALQEGDLYFNTTDDVMKVYEGATWVAAYASLSGALLSANNLADLASVAAARTNLGLGTAATTASTDYATAAQGALADSAVQPGDSPSFGSVSVTGTVDGRDVAADGAKLDGIEAGADVTDTANVTAAGALMDSEVTNLAAVKAFDPTNYATAAQGALADSATQPGDNISTLTNDAGYTTNVGDITGVTAGSGITGGGTSGTVTVSHADTSSQASVNNSGATVIQDVTLDTYGHVTALGSATLSLGSFGVTATATELNRLDGITATTTELNYTDGVTSNIQTQLNSKAANTTQAQATWEAGTSTTETIVSPAKVKAAANEHIDSAFNVSGSAPKYACRAWVNFNGTGTVAIRADGNVSSITDNGTGNYTVNFTSSFLNANFAFVATTGEGNSFPALQSSLTYSSSSVQFKNPNRGSSIEDAEPACVSAFQ